MAKAMKKKPGRKPAEDPLSVQMAYRVTPEEADLIRAAADADDRSMSQWSRLVILRAAQQSQTGS